MRKGLKRAGLVSLVLVCLALAAGSAWAESVTFTLSNGTDDTLIEFYASPPDTQEWEEDILGDEVLGPDESVRITIADGREDCQYDFLAVFESEDGETYELEHSSVSVCDGEVYVYE
jgi:hypothetical protein